MRLETLLESSDPKLEIPLHIYKLFLKFFKNGQLPDSATLKILTDYIQSLTGIDNIHIDQSMDKPMIPPFDPHNINVPVHHLFKKVTFNFRNIDMSGNLILYGFWDVTKPLTSSVEFLTGNNANVDLNVIIHNDNLLVMLSKRNFLNQTDILTKFKSQNSLKIKQAFEVYLEKQLAKEIEPKEMLKQLFEIQDYFLQHDFTIQIEKDRIKLIDLRKICKSVYISR